MNPHAPWNELGMMRLRAAWAAVAAVPGPKLTDASSSLESRSQAFAARLAAFRGPMSVRSRRPMRQETP
jgi:hypothetical protein